MAIKDFGQTWWGKKWIETLEKIDMYSNRLPRGRTYARNDSVKSIQMQGNQILSKVQGRNPSPYSVRIKLKPFSKPKKDEIIRIIKENPLILTELSLGRLPEELLEILQINKISLLPDSWSDFESTCSCPDWADPCKHRAAVYYLIASEIDKEPFILLNLRGMETKDLKGFSDIQSLKEKNKLKAKEIFIPKPKVIKNTKEEEFTASLQFPNFDTKTLFEILPNKPVFYPEDDFKKILQTAYKDAARSIGILDINEEIPIELKNSEFCFVFSGKSQENVHIFVTSDMVPVLLPQLKKIEFQKCKIPIIKEGTVQLSEKEGLFFSVHEIVSFFSSLPVQTTLKRVSESARFLSILTAISLSIVKSFSFLPELGWKNEEDFSIRYIPNLHNEKIAAAFRQLEQIFPTNIGMEKTSGKLMTVNGLPYLLSHTITSVFQLALISDKIRVKDKVTSVFFESDVVYVPETFQEKNIGKSISDWLERYSALRDDIVPVVSIEDEKSDEFRIELFAENKKDPVNPPVPLAHIFRDGNKKFFGQSTSILQNRLARQIAIAGEYLPELKTILNGRGELPVRIGLQRIGAILTESSSFLEYLGFRFILPKALKEILKPTLSMSVTAKSVKTISYFTLPEMLNFSWKISIGGVDLSEKEFKKLVKNADGIINFRGNYVMIDPAEMDKLFKKLEKPSRPQSPMDVLRSVLTGKHDGSKLVFDKTLQEIIENLTRVEEVEFPSDIKAQLRAYQLRGFFWMYSNIKKGFGCCIADDMGLGKTLQVISVLQKIKDENLLESPALVICPTSLIGNWKKEMERFAPSLRSLVYHGTEKTMNAKGYDAIITTYGLVRRYQEKFKKNKWTIIVIDEAQNVKNPLAEQTKALQTLKSNYKIAMSGTPVENRLTELWSIFEFLNPGYLKSLKDFKEEFAFPIERYRDKEAIQQLKTATAPFLIRRLKSDKTIISDLPDKIIMEEYCSLTKEQAVLYEQVVKDIFVQIESSEGIERKGLIFKLITYLKQICNHPVQFSKKGEVSSEHSGKAGTTMDLIEKILDNEQKTLIFTQYKEMGELLCQMLTNKFRMEVPFYHGSLTRKAREKMIHEFEQKDMYKILIISLKAGGTGLNLVSASNVIHYDLWWNPAVENQATDRAYRIGQQKNVQVHRLITMGTFEEKIDEIIKTKKELADLTVSEGETWITEMSNKELKSIFSLQK
ncbi:MAG: DEAD/DEAH box helicase [Leptospiraceae bacterium]|nr:DEAD/DEAH box helicase [Leptospiraceae bacterium]MCP5497925.1 DEAD/DEAH box helicase [Leptospiraceae bacterium]